MRTNWNSNTFFEQEMEASIAVQLGDRLEISGIIAMEGDRVIGVHDVVLQTEFVIKKIEHTLEEAGMKLSDLVRIRVFITDISLWNDVSEVYKYLLANIFAATTVLEVSALVHPDALIAIEATAIKEKE